MASLNKVILIGHLTRDPELRKVASGVSVAKMRLAVNETIRDRQTGQAREVTCFVDVTAWDRAAENCGKFLSKGSSILVDGRLTYEEWKTPQGEQRNRVSVRADRVQFMDSRPRDTEPAPQAQPPAEDPNTPPF